MGIDRCISVSSMAIAPPHTYISISMSTPVSASPRSSATSVPAAIAQRLTLQFCDSARSTADQNAPDNGTDVIRGLQQSPKTIPARYFYDDRGSDLFEQICDLPEYYLTRTETAIFQAHAPQIAAATGACELVELGSGSSTKTRLLLDAYQHQDLPLRYLPIDISAGMLESSAHRLLADYPSLKVHGIAGTYDQGLAQLPLKTLPTRMIAFIGSSLGNLAPQECDRFLAQIAAALDPGDYFLLGVDLQKPVEILTAAYNDRQGVTAAFNLNMLQHLNWRYGANFAVDQFQHEAIYNQEAHQIEMWLRSQTAQQIRLKHWMDTIDIAAEEAIRTEISRKFDPDTMATVLSQHGFQHLQLFTDAHRWFGVFLCQRQ